MEFFLPWLGVLISSFVPVFVVVFQIHQKKQLRLSKSEVPFPELRRRPAGEALRLKLGELDEQINDQIYKLVILPWLVTVVAVTLRLPLLFVVAPSGIISLVWSGVWGKKLSRTIQERWNYQLGFDGERYVGEELNRLIALGYEVYNDVPFDGFNMDHILVGVAGVFVVETKTRRKPVGKQRADKLQVEFDGSCLRWPGGSETSSLDQATNNARTLSRWLSSAVGDPVSAAAILTVPGWWVKRSKPCKTVQVLNPKEIFEAFKSKQEILDNSLIRRICHQLDQKCKIEIT